MNDIGSNKFPSTGKDAAYLAIISYWLIQVAGVTVNVVRIIEL
jgi:hypothetical protein